LPIGTALIVGVIDQPLLVDIRIKRTNHTGAAMIGEKKREKEPDKFYYFPKFLEDDVKKSIKKRLEQFKLVYYPLWRLSCKFKTKEGEKVDNLFLDGVTGELVYSKDNILNRTSGLPEIVGLKMKEKAVLLYLTSYGISTLEDMTKKLKLKEKNLEKIIETLKEKDLIKEQNKEYESLLKINFEKVVKNPLSGDTVGYKHAGELVPFKISKMSTNKFLDIFNPDEVERKKLYYPYWLIFYDDGKVDVVDGLTGERDDYLSEGSFEELAS